MLEDEPIVATLADEPKRTPQWILVSIVVLSSLISFLLPLLVIIVVAQYFYLGPIQDALLRSR